MKIHEQLLEQAKELLTREPKKPRQGSLRRAISNAYYAFFHFLVDQSTQQICGAAAENRPLRHALARAFTHNGMKSASKSFAGGNLPAILRWSSAVPVDLRFVANAFNLLQEERHRADYDLSSPFTRAEAQQLVQMAEQAIRQWKSVRKDLSSPLHLVALLVWNNLKDR